MRRRKTRWRKLVTNLKTRRKRNADITTMITVNTKANADTIIQKMSAKSILKTRIVRNMIVAIDILGIVSGLEVKLVVTDKLNASICMLLWLMMMMKLTHTDINVCHAKIHGKTGHA